MDQIQSAPATHQVQSHIVHVYQPAVTDTKMHNTQIIHISHPSLSVGQGNISYQQAIASDPLHIPVTNHLNEIQASQNLHGPLQTQVLQSTDLSQQIQITSHVILPQVPLYKQHVLLNAVEQTYYGQYGPYLKEENTQCEITKEEPSQLVTESSVESPDENTTENESQTKQTKRKKKRSQPANPNTWACNVRKLSHQRGEAYISRRGKFVPERHVKTMKDCQSSCKLKCNIRINDVDRELIFRAFYSLNANEKKHFLLNTTERNLNKPTKSGENNRRKYSYTYFFLVRAVRHIVCKKFYLGTLAISQKPIYNVHSGKSDMNTPKPDGRGLSETSAHPVSQEAKERVRNHIMSFTALDSKPIKRFSRRKQYLDPSLTIKQMYNMYFNECIKDNVVPVKDYMYRKIFNRDFNLYFKKTNTEKQLCYRCKSVIKEPEKVSKHTNT